MSQMMQRHSRVPPGFRFHPTDEELVGYYLHKKVSCRRIDLDVIRDIDLYKMEPWDLQEKCRIGSADQTEWYFFSHKDKKYPTGTRTNRATTAGFWKATGRDKTIHTKYSFVGMRKTLVFYRGRAPNGQKTDWIMHEYRLEDEQNNAFNCNQDQDGWVVCRVFKKKVNVKGQKSDSPYEEHHQQHQQDLSIPVVFQQQQAPFFCKQEFGGAELHPSFNCNEVAFSRLPQLESPRVSSGIGIKVSSMQAAAESQVIMRNSYPPPAFSLEAIEFDSSRVSMYEDDQQAGSMVVQAEQFTDWRAVDKLAAAQLSQEQQLAKDHSLRYPTMGESSAEDHELSGDVALLLRLSKQDFGGVAGTCDGELWSFDRENVL